MNTPLCPQNDIPSRPGPETVKSPKPRPDQPDPRRNRVRPLTGPGTSVPDDDTSATDENES